MKDIRTVSTRSKSENKTNKKANKLKKTDNLTLNVLNAPSEKRKHALTQA